MRGYIYIFKRTKDNSICYVGKHNGKNDKYITSSSVLIKKLEKNGELWFWNYYKKEIVHRNIPTLKDLNFLEKNILKNLILL